jgi:ribosomal protein S18 acetylase RimI-like enzyme
MAPPSSALWEGRRPTLREARPDELDTVGQVMEAAYQEYMPPNPSREWLAYREEVRDVRRRLGVSTLIVAEIDGRLVGAVTYYPDGSRETNAAWPPSWAVFRLLAVHPDVRGRGIGRLLTEECIRRARAARCEAVGLHTTHLMTVARTMYERMGFVRFPELDFFPAPQFRVMAYRLTL